MSIRDELARDLNLAYDLATGMAATDEQFIPCADWLLGDSPVIRRIQAEAKADGVREVAEQFERQAEIGPLHESQLTEEQRDWWTRNTSDGMLYGDDEEDAAIWLRNRADAIERGETA